VRTIKRRWLPIAVVVDATPARAALWLLLVVGAAVLLLVLVLAATIVAAGRERTGRRSAGREAARTTGWAAETAGTWWTAVAATAWRTTAIAAAAWTWWTAVAATTAGTRAAVAAASGTSRTRTTGTTSLAFACFVDAKHAPVELLPVELLQGSLRELRRGHLDKRKATRATGLAVHDDGHARYLSAVLTERLSERVLGRVVIQVAHVELRSHGSVS
jgi:hypothetical protein